MNTQTVELTAEIIREGERGDCTGCPVALGLCEVVPGIWFVDAFSAQWNSEDYCEYKEYEIAPGLGDDIAAFDSTGTMSPMTLIIDHDAKTITVQS